MAIKWLILDVVLLVVIGLSLLRSGTEFRGATMSSVVAALVAFEMSRSYGLFREGPLVSVLATLGSAAVGVIAFAVAKRFARKS